MRTKLSTVVLTFIVVIAVGARESCCTRARVTGCRAGADSTVVAWARGGLAVIDGCKMHNQMVVTTSYLESNNYD